ncbi:hypothetical protein ACGFYV_27340 [Streptomyces sp. NPDC048297]|uniref:hypothetical protein n=1 Tax=Streptomyces sp. NPDC048297 TaxID=3365531 RepID=UPI00371D892C
MSQDVLVVVGNQFADFRTNRGTVSASELLERLRAQAVPYPLHVSVGQGLLAGQLAELKTYAAPGRGPLVLHQDDVPEPAEHRVVRPRHPRTALLGPVERVAEGHFVAPLLLDERIDPLQDRLSSQHISGITLLEAARQTWNLVTDQYLLDAERRTRYVISEVREIRAVYHRYLFPLPATVEFLLRERDPGPFGESIAFTVSFRQNGRLTTEVFAEIRVLPEPLARKQESLAARQALHDELERTRQGATATAVRRTNTPTGDAP